MSKYSCSLARRGTHDGLAGLYCIINAIRNDERLETFSNKDLLRYLLEAATRLNNLSPAKISLGYEAHELTDIFNEFARALDLSWRAGLLVKVRRAFPLCSPTVVSRRIFEEKGKILINTGACGCWLFSYTLRFNEKKIFYMVEDPNPMIDRKRISQKRVGEVGVVILPVETNLANAL